MVSDQTHPIDCGNAKERNPGVGYVLSRQIWFLLKGIITKVDISIDPSRVEAMEHGRKGKAATITKI